MEERNIIDEYGDACGKLPECVRKAEAEGRREKIMSLSVTGGALVGSRSCDVTTVSVRTVGKNGRIGYAYTQNLEENPEKVMERAVENSELTDLGPEDEGLLLFADDREDPGKCPEAEKEGVTADFDTLSVEEGIRIGAMVEGWACESGEFVEQATVTIAFYETCNWIVNSLGLRRESRHGWLDASVDAVLQKEGNTYNISWHGSFADESELREKKEEMRRCLLRGQMAKSVAIPFTSGVYRVLLSRESLCMMMVGLWKAFSGCHQQIGDSFLTDRMGEKVASGVFSVKDAPSVKGCGYGRSFDSEGVPAREKYLIRDGVLTGRIHNLASAAYFGEKPTGNAGRAEGFFSGLPTGVTAIPNVTYILPGEMSEEDMLSRVGDGVWITETYDPFHSIQVGNGEFAIPCNGVRVVDGKPVGVLNSLTITGNLASLLLEIEAVGDTVAFQRFYTGLYYLGGPDVLVAHLQVNG